MSENTDIVDTIHDWIRLTMRQSMNGFIRYTKEAGLSMSQMGALFRIRRAGACGVADIGADLQVSNAAASQILDRLVQLGYVLRNENPEDRRGKLLKLTDKGRTFFEGSRTARMQWAVDLVDSLSPDERRSAAETISMLVRKAAALDPGVEHASCPVEGGMRL